MGMITSNSWNMNVLSSANASNIWGFPWFPVSLPSIKANPSLFKEQARLLPKVAPGTGRDPSIPVLKIQDFWVLPQQDLQHPKGKVSAVLFGEDVQQLPRDKHFHE